MYLSSDSSSILVSCHRSPLSIIHYYPLSIIHYCNIATLHCNIPLSIIHYCGSLNHPRQKLSLNVSLFFVGSPSAFLNLPFLEIHLPKKHLFLVFSSHSYLSISHGQSMSGWCLDISAYILNFLGCQFICVPSLDYPIFSNYNKYLYLPEQTKTDAEKLFYWMDFKSRYFHFLVLSE